MQLERKGKKIKDLERIIKSFDKLEKAGASKIQETVLKFGKLEIENTFHGYIIILRINSRVLKNGLGRSFNICTYKNHSEKIENKLYPLLICMVKEITVNLKAKLTELNKNANNEQTTD